jgi:hypothetical protein
MEHRVEKTAEKRLEGQGTIKRYARRIMLKAQGSKVKGNRQVVRWQAEKAKRVDEKSTNH